MCQLPLMVVTDESPDRRERWKDFLPSHSKHGSGHRLSHARALMTAGRRMDAAAALLDRRRRIQPLQPRHLLARHRDPAQPLRKLAQGRKDRLAARDRRYATSAARGGHKEPEPCCAGGKDDMHPRPGFCPSCTRVLSSSRGGSAERWSRQSRRILPSPLPYSCGPVPAAAQTIRSRIAGLVAGRRAIRLFARTTASALA